MSAELSTIGITLGYATEATAGTRPTTGYTTMDNVTTIGEISLESETLEVTNLVDTVHRYIDGLKGGSESVSVTVNMNKACLTAWQSARTAAKTAWEAGKATWWQVTVPSLGAFYFAGIPSDVGMNEIAVNEVLAVDMNITVSDIAGWVASE